MMSINTGIGKDTDIVKFKKGEEIYIEDQIGNTIYFIKTGQVTLFKLKGDNFIHLDGMTTNDVFGYLPFIYGEQRRFTSALASEDTELINITKKFMDFFEKAPDFLKLFISSSSKKLKRAYFELKNLQYFENIHYEDAKRKNLQTYHVKDVMRFSIILMLGFDRYNFTITQDFFENLVFSLLSRVTIKMSVLLSAFDECNIINIDQENESSPSINLINHELLEDFNNYLSRNFIKDPRRLLLNETQVELIGMVCQLIETDNKKIVEDFITKKNLNAKSNIEKDILLKKLDKEINKSTFSFTRDDLLKMDGVDIDSGKLVFEGLSDRGILDKQAHESGKMQYSIVKKEAYDIYNFQKIIKTVEKSL
jgi:CRP-like cAMP-binding protein